MALHCGAAALRVLTVSERRIAQIESLLREALAAHYIEVIDDSAQHAGHAGAASGAGHFRLLVVSEQFEGKARIAAQRLVYGALAEMMESEIHALSIRSFTPEAWERESAVSR